MRSDVQLKAAQGQLKKAAIGTARLDALVLLEDVVGKDRGWLLAHPEFELSKAQEKKLDKLIERRAAHEPLAYIRGKTEFYGREFIINEHVLEPRPESETMISLLRKLANRKRETGNRKITIMDVGTGSGALAITAKLEVLSANVIATDIDPNCLKVARKNASKLTADVQFLRGDLLAPLEPAKIKNSTLLCNLPYVPDSFRINPAAMNEPRIAIFGGPDGLDIYRKLFQQIDELRAKPEFILTESMPPQHEKLVQIASASGYHLTKTDDFIQLFELADAG